MMAKSRICKSKIPSIMQIVFPTNTVIEADPQRTQDPRIMDNVQECCDVVLKFIQML